MRDTGAASTGSRPGLVAMKAYVGQTRSPALIAELERHGIGECVVCGELPVRRLQFFYAKDRSMWSKWLRRIIVHIMTTVSGRDRPDERDAR